MGNPEKRFIYITAAILFFIDAFVMNQGGIAVILLFLIVVWWLPKSIYKKYKKQSPRADLHKALIFGLTALAVFSANTLNNKIARHRAENLVSAIESYRQATGQYPQQLADLVPVYLPEVPKAKYTFISSDFFYRNHEGEILFFYTDLPPFGRPTYDFDSKSWIYID